MTAVLYLDDDFRNWIQPAVHAAVQIADAAFEIGVTDDTAMNVHRPIFISAGHTAAAAAGIHTGRTWNSRKTGVPAAVDDLIVSLGTGIVSLQVVSVNARFTGDAQRIQAHEPVLGRQQHGHQ